MKYHQLQKNKIVDKVKSPLNHSPNFIKIINHFEGCKLVAYPDSRSIYTLGVGCIRIDGRPVKKGDVITQAKADEMLSTEVSTFEIALNKMLGKVVITQSMFDSLLCFQYNLGTGALAGSTLLKKVLKNQNDLSIKNEFIKWRDAGKSEEKGLLLRRLSEYHLYSTGEISYDFMYDVLAIMRVN